MFSLSCLGGPWSCEAYWTALFFTPLLFSICLSILPPDLTSAVPLLHVSWLFLLCHSMTFCSSTLFLYYLLPFLPQLPQYICLPFFLQPRVSWLVFLLPSCFTFWLVRSCWLSLPLYPPAFLPTRSDHWSYACDRIKANPPDQYTFSGQCPPNPQLEARCPYTHTRHR